MELQELYKSLIPKNKQEGEEILKEFMKNKFTVELSKKCNELKISIDKCYPIQKTWNNASFAAFLTYENKTDELGRLQEKRNLNLKEFYKYIVNKYEEYEKLDNKDKDSFSKYLLKDAL